MRKNEKGFGVILVIIIILIVLVAGFALYSTYKPTQTYQDVNQNEAIVYNGSSESINTHKIKVSTDVTFPHEYLPGFDISIPSSWSTSIKQFGEKDTIGFTYRHAKNAPIEGYERTMGVRLSKNGVIIDFIFGVASDNNAYSCEIDESTDIGNSWYRLKDNNGYFYSKSVEQEDGKTCYRGTGMYLNEYTPKEVDPEGLFGGLLLLNPKILGNPDQTLLIEVDKIVKSIKGLEE
ncbi:MAG: hypothetical protein AAB546_00710 [Patescibacteria group bacterium]